MKPHNTYVEKFRQKKFERSFYGMNGNSGNGVFRIPTENLPSVELNVVISDGGGWDHVSVSRTDEQTPTWDDMCMVKRLFFSEDETVVQYHPKESEYVNFHKNCLHLWKKQDYEFPLPPSIFVGPKMN